jgi:hypothetical protein
LRVIMMRISRSFRFGYDCSAGFRRHQLDSDSTLQDAKAGPCRAVASMGDGSRQTSAPHGAIQSYSRRRPGNSSVFCERRQTTDFRFLTITAPGELR